MGGGELVGYFGEVKRLTGMVLEQRTGWTAGEACDVDVARCVNRGYLHAIIGRHLLSFLRIRLRHRD